MASSSSSRRTWKYDVFPSFRGEDVRRSFLSHFLEKLRGKSINTFTDNSIQRSRPITPELLSAIRESRISILVFSKNYASSTWCLNELAAILGCYKELGQIVIPVFYEVDPSDVRKQTGEFGKAFEKTCEGKREDDIKRWKKALEEVASIAGYDSRNWSDEAKMIEHISSDVSNKLFTPSVGIGAHVEAIMDSLLCLESVRVRIVEILGPSGIGKSTIANIAGEDSKNWYSCGDSLDNMKRGFTPIAQLNHVAEKKIWKIKARVSRIWRFQNNDKPGDVDRLELILVDDKGDRIQACIERKLISKFEKDFEEGECRILMNFKLFRNGGSFRGSTHPFKIFFTWSTYVKNCEEIPNHSLRFNFIPFEELLSQSHDEKVFVDVIGEIIEVHGLKKVNARNVPCKLLNLQLKSISGSTIDCVFWGKYAEDIHAYVQSFSGGPIVMLCSLMRINIYNGKVSIQSVKSSTKLFMNVDIAEINEFKEKMPKDVISTTPSVSILALSNSDQVSSDNFSLVSCKTISQLLTSHEPQEITCSIYATICALKTEIPWFYIGCTKCFKKVNEYLNPETEEIEADKFTCDTCEKICTSTVTRYQVHVKAMDETGTTSFLLFDKEVIQLIHKSTYELLEQQVQFNRRIEFPPELLALANRQFVFTVYKPSTTKNSRPTTFKVVKITDDPAKLSMFCGDDVNTNDTAAIGPNFSNSTAFTTNLIDDVSFKASKNNSTSGSTEYPETPNKKRTITYVEMSSPIEDSNAQLSSKKHKPKLAALTGGETGQPKPKAEPRTN